MIEPHCPGCDLAISPPRGSDPTNESMRSALECPGCGRPLTWFADGGTTGRWIRDEDAEGRIRMQQGPDA